MLFIKSQENKLLNVCDPAGIMSTSLEPVGKVKGERKFHASCIQSFYKGFSESPPEIFFNISLSISWSFGHHSTCKEDQYGLSWPA